MIHSKDLRQELEDIIYILASGYSPAQLEVKNDIEIVRYKEAKMVYEEADDAIGLCDIEWDDDSDEDYKVINQLIEELRCEIEMMEEDLKIY